ncbi:MAG TPA: sugar phosphate isomerase/epimerase [Propionicimonas sp.]|jgi:sugar phosphate isomerase/epimerase|uniref:sugar phosphate isomerase/epimerase family protein n=1 Tax=Propionicimonas sp. TaxID=1955623 RepID=UPI002F413FBA
MKSSLQLWSLRTAIEAIGWEDTLRRLPTIGWSTVEPFAVDIMGTHIVSSQAGDVRLAAPTCHGFLEADRVEATLAAAAAMGARTVFHPHFAPEWWADESAIARTASTLTTAARLAAGHGITVGFHNHDFELTHTVHGVPAFELLLDSVPADVVVEYDLYWAMIAGLDPAVEVRRLGDRLGAVHIKDAHTAGPVPRQCALGEGDVDIDGALAAAPQDALVVLSLDLMAGDAAALWRAVETSRAWLDTRGITCWVQ